MIIEKTYSDFDLQRGKCKSCGDKTKIVIDDGRCPDCIEADEFYKLTS